MPTPSTPAAAVHTEPRPATGTPWPASMRALLAPGTVLAAVPRGAAAEPPTLLDAATQPDTSASTLAEAIDGRATLADLATRLAPPPHAGRWSPTSAIASAAAALLAARTATVVRSPLLSGIATLSPPPRLAPLDDALLAATPGPDFLETSVRVTTQIDPFRLTYYFDAVDGDRSVGVAAARAAFSGTGNDSAAAAAAWLASSDAAAVRQTVVGIDGGGDRERLKLYFVFDDGHGDTARTLLRALDVDAPQRDRWSHCRIVGLDFCDASLHDVKLYWALPPDQVARTLRRPGRWRPLIDRLRRGVLQESVLQQRPRRLHLASADETALRLVIDRELSHLAGTARLWEHVDLLARDGAEVSPAILSMDYEDGNLVADREYTVYLHPARPGTY